MDTKRCPQCHKMLRADAQSCSLCGHDFAQATHVKRNATSTSRVAAITGASQPSQPPASPHRAGHYSGFHPEDQPFQSSFMAVVSPSLDEPVATRGGVWEEPEGTLLSNEDRAWALPLEDADDLQDQSYESSESWGRSYRADAAALAMPPAPGLQRQTKKLGRLVASPAQLPAPRPQRNLSSRFPPSSSQGSIPQRRSAIDGAQAGHNSTQAEYSYDFQGNPYMPPVPAAPGRATQASSPHMPPAPAPTGSETPAHPRYGGPRTPLPQISPMPLKPQKPARTAFTGRTVPILLIVACLLILLATSILAFLLLNLNERPASQQSPSSAAPNVQLSTSNIDLGADGKGGTSSQKITLTNAGAQQVNWEASSDANWLTIAPNYGSLPATANISLTLVANRGTLAPQVYTGHITFTQQGTKKVLQSLNVTMTVTSAPASLVLSTASLSYYSGINQNPADQVITVQNAGAQPLDWGAVISSSNTNASWLSISPNKGHLAANAALQLTVSVQAQGLAVGLYQGTISFQGGANPQLAVTLNVASPGNLVVSLSSLAFQGIVGQNAAVQTLIVQNSGGQALDWTGVAATTNGGNWLSVSPAYGHLSANTSAVLTVNANAASLSAGSYQGNLIFSYGGAPSTQVTITFSVSPLPVPGLAVKPNSLNFSSIQGTNPPAQTFLISDTGNAPLNWAISEDANGKAYVPVTPPQGTVAPGKSAAITIAPNVAKLNAQTLAAVLTIFDSDKGTQVRSQQVAMTMTIINQAQINVSVNAMTFNNTSQIPSSTELLVITNTGSAVLNWTIAQGTQPPVPWLSVDVSSGTLIPSEAMLVNVTCNSSQMSPGTYTATLVVSDSDHGSPVPSQTITITLTVSS